MVPLYDVSADERFIFVACASVAGVGLRQLDAQHPRSTVGTTSFAAEQILLRRAGAAAEALRCRSSRR